VRQDNFDVSFEARLSYFIAMTLKRFYCENISGNVVELGEQETRHAVGVMRLGKGECIEVVDGKGGIVTAVIENAGKKKILLKIESFKKVPPKQTGRVIIATSIAKGDRFEWLISKCTELGVDRIVPVIFERTVKLAKGDNAADRWKNVAVSAIKQCGSLFLPVIDRPIEFSKAIEIIKAEYPLAKFVVGWCGDEAVNVDMLDIIGKDVVAVVGPEGGFSPADEKLFMQIEIEKVSLGENILRTETAAIAFGAIFMAKNRKKYQNV
jgi:16S rRNA (uracil1498-N3)-methyltransferase